MYRLFNLQIIHEYVPFTPSFNLRLYLMFIAPCSVIHRNNSLQVHCMAILLTLWPAASSCDEIIGKVNTKPFILQLTTVLSYWCTQYIYIHTVFQIRRSNIWSFPMQEVTFLSPTQIMLNFLTDKILVWKPFLLQTYFFFFLILIQIFHSICLQALPTTIYFLMVELSHSQ